ncbi:MAG: response regulator [Deltaproteobacteria bacterium]
MSDLPPSPRSSAPPRGLRRAVVLLVDDDRAITRMLEAILKRTLDVDVIVSNSGFGLLNTIAAERPDVVLLDVMMPGLDGQDAMRLIRGDPDLSRTRVVLHSATDEPSLAKLAAACGADDFVQKGARPKEVARRLGRWTQSAAMSSV